MNQRSCPRPSKGLNLVGPFIRSYREKQGMSQQVLAEALQRKGWDVDRVVITRIETGARTVTDYEIAFLLKVLNVRWIDIAPLLDELS